MSRKYPEAVVHVTDRTWDKMAGGVSFERWPGDLPPEVGDHVVIFDKNLDFTQHYVLKVKGMSVLVGEAIPWTNERRRGE